MTKNNYPVFKMIPETGSIIDFRGSGYREMESHGSEGFECLPEVDAREFIMDLAKIDSSILNYSSEERLINRLERLASAAELSASLGLDTAEKISYSFALRNNIYQMTRLIMKGLLDVVNYGAGWDRASVEFTGRTKLILFPYLEHNDVRGLDSVLLYKDNVVEALATEDPQIHSEKRGFWSRGNISQRVLAEYWEAAIEVADRIERNPKKNDLKNKKINDLWWFQRIVTDGLMTRRYLKNGNAQVLTANPGRFPEELKD